MHITFRQIKTIVKKSGKCPICGKRSTKQQTICNTVNPFNKDKDGNVKSPDQVYQDVKAEAANWKPDFTCSTCKE
jgi:hypothetical protein